MFRLLALVATTLAAPQYYPQYVGYSPISSLYGYPTYPVSYYDPFATRAIYGGPGAPVVQVPRADAMDNTRAFFGAGALQEVNGRFIARDITPPIDAANVANTSPNQVILGTVTLTQNALTNVLFNNDAQYKIYVSNQGPNDLTGQNIIVALAADCQNPAAATGTPAPRVATLNVPAHFNGFYLSGATTGFNLDGTNGKTDLTAVPNRIQILNAAGTQILGCNDMDLA